ncbi:hydroxyisourate hydrolase [Nonomuraea sp. B19D2]|uniref:hydroxyisourate hydrolase n=1 Tax=Nonomuraea sp. B19D2 TaxID=3159561 RepID=UPI0032DB0441
MNITVDVIDWTNGRPASGIAVRLERHVGGIWEEPVKRYTDENGWLTAWQSELATATGLYRLEFNTDEYYATLGIIPFNPRVAVTFRIREPFEDYHLPVLVTPYGCLAYRTTSPRKPAQK